MHRILITGIPGTGKTSIGDYLAAQRAFFHLDLEGADRTVFFADPGSAMERLVSSPCDVVLTWGFPPNDDCIALVRFIAAIGFKLIWLDGDRAAARAAFIRRKTVSVGDLNRQMQAIEVSKVVERIAPTIINPFNQDGTFKTRDAIANEILSA